MGKNANKSLLRCRVSGRMSFARFAFCSVFVALVGCTSVKQFNATGGEPFDSFGYYGDLHCGLLQIGPSSAPKSIRVLDGESYAIGPEGTRFGILSEPHPYDLRPDRDPLVPYVRDRIYLVDGDGERTTRNWTDGLWRFHFVIATASGREVRDFQLEVSSFNYNPIVHGPPN
jgi:hypothetical protein